MASDIKALRIFIASPGGLEEERKQFSEVLARYNTDHAFDLDFTFIPRGHDYSRSGAGRPQSLINEQIETSDYLVVVLWNHWGMPTDEGPGAKYTSGTEEEFYVGMDCLSSQERPMKDIAVLFKDVADDQLRDPGPQLAKVLEFQKKLEADRQLLYRTFGSPADFADELRSLFAQWLRDWRDGEPGKALGTTRGVTPPSVNAANGGAPEFQSSAPSPLGSGSASTLDRARAAAAAGREIEARQLFAQATSGAWDGDAWTYYLRFLRQTNRRALVRTVAQTMMEKARLVGDWAAIVEAQSNIGILRRSEGHRTGALTSFNEALASVDLWENEVGQSALTTSTKAFLLDNRALTLRRMRGRLQDAVADTRRATELHARVGDKKGQAHGLRNAGVLDTQLGRSAEAVDRLQQALALFLARSDVRGQAMTLSALCDAYEVVPDLAQARISVDRALVLNRQLANVQGISMNLVQLSRVALAEGNLDEALSRADECLDLNDDVGETEGLASALLARGNALLELGDSDRAEELLHDSFDIFRSLDQPAGLAAAGIAWARALHQADNARVARRVTAAARDALDSMPNAALEVKFRTLPDAFETERP